MTRKDYTAQVVARLRPSKTGRSSGVFNSSKGKFYTANYARQKRAMKNPHFAKAVAVAHDRALKRGVRGLPKERFYPKLYEGKPKVGRGQVLVGKARVWVRVWGTKENGKAAKGLRLHLVVPIPPTDSGEQKDLLEVIEAQIMSFNFQSATPDRQYLEEIDEVEIEDDTVELELHAMEGEAENETPF